jgi:prepilin-type processing-associated H-X9-DG protein
VANGVPQPPHQIGVGLHNYHDNYRMLPPGYIYRASPQGNAAGFGWGAMLLPLLEQDALFRSFHWGRADWDPANLEARQRRLPIFLCPTDHFSQTNFVEMGPTPDRFAMGSFVANYGPPDLDVDQEKRDGLFSRNSSMKLRDVSDGLAYTLMVGERANGPFRSPISDGPHVTYETTWCCAVRQQDENGVITPTDDHGHMVLFQTGHVPNDPLSDDRDVSAPHAGFAQFLFADGSVRPISSSVDFNVYTALGTRAGGEQVSIRE